MRGHDDGCSATSVSSLAFAFALPRAMAVEAGPH